jgi:hypothetical protein
MAYLEIHDLQVSPEETLENTIRELIAKIVSGEATEPEKTRLQEAIAQRSRLMRSDVFDKESEPGIRRRS